MDNLIKRLTKVIFILIGFFLVIVAICYFVGIRYNSTASIAVGFYLTENAPIEKGRYVIFCPPKNDVFDEILKRHYISAGFCTGGYGKMIKRVMATTGDIISVNDDGVRVNDELLPRSKPIAADKAGRPLPHFRLDHYTIKPDEVLLMSDVNPISFDGRYFGTIKRAQIKEVVRPLYTW